MPKFRHVFLTTEANRFSTPKGNSYLFLQHTPTVINDKDDASYFKAHEDFVEIGMVDEVKEKITNALKERKADSEYEKALEGIDEQTRENLKKEFPSLKHAKRASITKLILVTGKTREEAVALKKKLTGG